MNKKLLGVLLACGLVVSQGITAFAAPSGTSTMTAVSETTTVAEVADFSTIVEEKEALEVITVTNTAGVSDAQIIEAVNKTGDVKIEAAAATFVTKFFDVKVEKKSDDGKYHAQLNVPSLPANANVSNVKGLHYSTVRQVWEVLDAISVNGSNVEFAMEDTSPITIFVTGVATAPKTGEANTWVLYIGLAAAMLTVAGISEKKARNN